MARKFSVQRFWSDIRKYRITAMNYVGELCTYLVNQPELENDSAHTLRKMVGNGMRHDIFSVMKNRFGVKKIIELYGASEGDMSFVNIFGLDGTIGFNLVTPFAVVKYDIENDELVRDENGFLIRVKKGEPGILLGEARKSVNILGYTDKKETEKKMIYDAFQKGDRWFNTGDMIRNMGFGHYEFVDRTGDTFRWKGEIVSTTEAEKVVNSFKQVTQSSAYGTKFGDGDGRLGMLALLPQGNPDEFNLSAFGKLLLNSLPAYAIPRFLRFTSKFDSTPTFKIKKNTLKEEGFDLNQIKDPLFVILPGEERYQSLTEKLFVEINEGKYRF